MAMKARKGSINIVNKSDQEAEILVYGEIVENATDWWTGEEIPGYYGQEAFIEALKNLRDKEHITVRINSFGGYIHVAQAMYTQLRAIQAKKTVIVDGVAASAAVLVMLAGDEIKISAGALVMIHEPALGLYGYYDAPELERMITELTVTKDAIMETYISHTNLEKARLSEMMAAETWMTGREAVDYGFATELINETTPEMVMCADRKHMLVNGHRFNIESCRNLPELPVENSNETKPTEREIERRLRDSGVPKKAATAMAAQYSSLCLRDSGTEKDNLLRDSEVAAKLQNVLDKAQNFRKTVKGEVNES